MDIRNRPNNFLDRHTPLNSANIAPRLCDSSALFNITRICQLRNVAIWLSARAKQHKYHLYCPRSPPDAYLYRSYPSSASFALVVFGDYSIPSGMGGETQTD